MNNRTVLLDDIFGKVFKGHHYTSGQFSAEALREELLVPILRNAIDHDFTITLVSRRLSSASKSYLEEAFGKLIVHGHFTKSEINKYLRLEINPSLLRNNFSKLINDILDKAEIPPKSKYISTMKDGISSGRYVPNYLNAYYNRYLNSVSFQQKYGRGSSPVIMTHELDEVEFHNGQTNEALQEHLKRSVESAITTMNPNKDSKRQIEQRYLRSSLFSKLYKVMGGSLDGTSIANCLNNNYAIDTSKISEGTIRYILAVARSFSIDLHVKDNHLLNGDQPLDIIRTIEPNCIGFESDTNARLLRLETVYYQGSKYIMVFKTKLNGVVAYTFDRSEFGHEDLDLTMKFARHKHAGFKRRPGSKCEFIFDYILGYYFIDMNQLELYGCEEYNNPSELKALLGKLPPIEDSTGDYKLDVEIFTKMETSHDKEGTIEARGMDFDVVIADDATFSRGLTPFPSPICDYEVSNERGLTSCVLPMDDSPYQTSPEKIRNSSIHGSHGSHESQSYERDNSTTSDTSSSSDSSSGGCD